MAWLYERGSAHACAGDLASGTIHGVSEMEDASNAVHEATPAGWYVGFPSYHDERREWLMYAFDPTERLRTFGLTSGPGRDPAIARTRCGLRPDPGKGPRKRVLPRRPATRRGTGAALDTACVLQSWLLETARPHHGHEMGSSSMRKTDGSALGATNTT